MTENNNNWFHQLGNYIPLNIDLINLVGRDSAIFLGVLISWEGNLLHKKRIQDQNEFFYLVQSRIESKTLLSSYQQLESIKRLQNLNFITVERRLPSGKNFYRINRSVIEKALSKTHANEKQVSEEISLVLLDGTNGADVESQVITNNHTDISGQMPEEKKTMSLSENFSQPKYPLPEKLGDPLPEKFGHYKLKSSKENLNLKSKPKSLKSKDSSNLYNFKDLAISTQPPVEISGDGNGKFFKPSLIKRNKSITIEFEAPPRQRYRKDVLDIINYWNNSQGLRHHRVPFNTNGTFSSPTNTFLEIVSRLEQVIDGKFFNYVGLSKYNKKYTKEELISVIDKFKLMASHPSYLPHDKSHLKQIGLKQFFYNDWVDCFEPSYFVKCIEEDPVHITNIIPKEKEKNPQTTKWLREIYIDKVLLGISKKFNQREENQFIIGANRLFDIPRQLNSRLNMITGPREWVEIFIKSLIDHWGIDKVPIGRVCSDHSFSTVLTQYLLKKGRIDRRGTPDIITKENSPYQPDRGDIL